MAKRGEYQRHMTVRGRVVKDELPSKQGESRALELDPFEIAAAQDYLISLRAGHEPIFNSALRDAANEPTFAAVRALRRSQVAELCTPREDEFGLGFDIVLREREAHMSRADHKESDRIRDLLMTCGETDTEYDLYCRSGFEAFTRMVIDDSLNFDSGVFYVILDRAGRPSWWKAVDAATIFKCTPTTVKGTHAPEDAAYVQVIQGQEKVFWPADEMCMGIRNPTTDIRNKGYGQPEIYTIQHNMAALFMSMAENSNLQKNGGMKGVFMVKGEMQAEQLRLFKRQVLYNMTGYRNVGRFPIVNPVGPDADIKWIPFAGLSPADMQRSEWMNYNIRVTCSVLQCDPGEIGHYFHQEGGEKAPMFETSPEAKLRTGKDKGLRPLVRNYQHWLNTWIVHRLNPRFQVRFLGLDAMSEESRADLDKKLLEMGAITISELRAERNKTKLKPLAERLPEDMPMSPTYMQAHQFVVQNQAAQAQQEAGGAEGGEEPGAVAPEGEEQQTGAQDQQQYQGQPGAGEVDTPPTGAAPGAAPENVTQEAQGGAQAAPTQAEAPEEGAAQADAPEGQPEGKGPGRYDWTLPGDEEEAPKRKREPEAAKSLTFEV